MTSRVPFWEPVLGEREKQLVAEILDSGFINDGTTTVEFERRIAELCGVPYAVAVTSGTAAIFLALAAHGIGPGDEVIVPDVTFIATANAVTLAGARPVLVDIEPETLCLDPSCTDAAVTSRTKAIVPVHISGRAANMPALKAIAKRHGLAIVEDAAHALGSHAFGAALGSLGDAGCFSFSPNKIITTGQGGMVITRDAAVHRRLRELKDQGRPERGTGGADIHPSVGFNFKFTNIQAAIGLAQFATLSQRLARLRRTYELYWDELAALSGVHFPGFDLGAGASPQWVDILVKEDRDGLCKHLERQGVATLKFWYPLHSQAPYSASDEAFPVATRFAAQALWLPSSITLRDEQIRMVCSSVRAWAEGKT